MLAAHGCAPSCSRRDVEKGRTAARPHDSIRLATTIGERDSGGIDRAVAVEYFGGDAQICVDANKDGNFTATSDLVIRANAITANAFTLDDFWFG